MPHLVTPCHEPLPARRWPALGGATAGFMALILAGCAGGLTGSAAQVPCPSAVEAPVLYPRDTWFYRNEDGQEWMQTYGLGTEEGLLRGRGPTRAAEHYYDHAHTLRKVYSQGMWLTQATREFPLIGQADLVFPLVPGKTWSLSMRDQSFGLVILVHLRVAGCEQVTVPAGSFVAVRLDLAANVPGVPGAYQDATYIYALAVKNRVEQTVAPGPLQKVFVSFELESFMIDIGKPATN
jgi:hypothetical protein